MSETRQPSPTVPAATVLLVRDGAAGLEVFMVVRHHQIDFASGALVFPGGKADKQDFDLRMRDCSTGGVTDANLFGAQVAALRETFEECGILLATDQATGCMIDCVRLADLQKHRQPIVDGELGFADFLCAEKLTLDCTQLGHFAHWITPEMMPKRFDTHFFVATAPQDHLALHDGHESVDSVWTTPATALAEAAEGKRTIIFPTLRNIEKLAEFATVAEVHSHAKSHSPYPVLPWMERRGETQVLCIPPEAGYAVNEEIMPPRKS